jgi:RNA polymerase sigma factor (sigma-70 family)
LIYEGQATGVEKVNDLRTQIIRVTSGDLEAFAEIVHRFQDMACGYAYSVLGDWHLAEDAAQEAFIEAYRSLSSLRNPEAFPGWFRRIVFKYCDRIRRKKNLEMVSLEAVAAAPAENPGPSERLRVRELEQRVLEAVQSLPERQREATMLYYINGYSQQEIADFLEEPVSTVKKRLHDSRRKLKERMVGMVSETLKQNAPDERFSQRVIAGLLARPRPMEIEGHPVREVFEIIRSALPGYEYIEGGEIVEPSEFVVEPDAVYSLKDGRILRPETTLTTLRAMAGRTPPIRLLAAGRVFRAVGEDEHHLKVFHQLDGLCVAEGAGVEMMKQTITKVLERLVSVSDIRWVADEFPRFDNGMSAGVMRGGEMVELIGCGTLSPETLEEGGLEPGKTRGFAIGMGLERLAMLKYGIQDVRELWKPPYVGSGSA